MNLPCMFSSVVQVSSLFSLKAIIGGTILLFNWIQIRKKKTENVLNMKKIHLYSKTFICVEIWSNVTGCFFSTNSDSSLCCLSGANLIWEDNAVLGRFSDVMWCVTVTLTWLSLTRKRDFMCSDELCVASLVSSSTESRTCSLVNSRCLN